MSSDPRRKWNSVAIDGFIGVACSNNTWDDLDHLLEIFKSFNSKRRARFRYLLWAALILDRSFFSLYLDLIEDKCLSTPTSNGEFNCPEHRANPYEVEYSESLRSTLEEGRPCWSKFRFPKKGDHLIYEEQLHRSMKLIWPAPRW